jgi:hypothetical protein
MIWETTHSLSLTALDTVGQLRELLFWIWQPQQGTEWQRAGEQLGWKPRDVL